MSQIVTQNPGSSEIQSPLIAGITEGLNKLSAVLNLKTGTLEDVQLTAVSIDNEEKNKNRIYEANFGNRLWLSSPAPVIKKNGSEITQSGSNFTIDYIGGSITFSADSKPADGDTITVSATYIIAESDALNAINTALSAVQTQSSKYKGNYDNVSALQLAHSSAENGDYAIVFDPLAVYAWKNDGWYDTRSIEDLSDYYNKGETNNLLGQKEPTIQQKGSSASDDDFYWGGRKTWQDFKEKVRSTVLTGLSTASDAAVSATDTLLVAVGKLQAQASKATQRAYLTGTGAPSTSTVGAVGQRYVNTSNGDEYTCEEVSGGTYTWRLHTRSVNGKRPETPGGDVSLTTRDIEYQVGDTITSANGAFDPNTAIGGTWTSQTMRVQDVPPTQIQLGDGVTSETPSVCTFCVRNGICIVSMYAITCTTASNLTTNLPTPLFTVYTSTPNGVLLLTNPTTLRSGGAITSESFEVVYPVATAQALTIWTKTA